MEHSAMVLSSRPEIDVDPAVTLQPDVEIGGGLVVTPHVDVVIGEGPTATPHIVEDVKLGVGEAGI